ncbi:hypothetical protein TNCV_1872891 [Trichonephila clavipes]|nr:hypothetical protein TNCV_1872891 [Trichonephila clavipes]
MKLTMLRADKLCIISNCSPRQKSKKIGPGEHRTHLLSADTKPITKLDGGAHQLHPLRSSHRIPFGEALEQAQHLGSVSLPPIVQEWV